MIRGEFGVGICFERMEKPLTEQLTDLASHILTMRPDAVRARQFKCGELTLLTDKDHLIELLSFLRDDDRCLFVSAIFPAPSAIE
ncbi:hypothetical protein CO657_32885 (plasmid) [Rhizobium acidisoli]|uniref:Uncharacterized protein n=1 Tax=Rhizobium acidisoli TaxID=1538158 RepID=A0AAE5WU80_9HYPH|nr:hypothetical protein [Rhizobium acidisoli]QAS82607.1 hypothetical protein CO657_32885 [Rhizobium acidisoli]